MRKRMTTGVIMLIAAMALNAPVLADDLKAGLKALDDKKFPVALKAFDKAFQAGKSDGAFYLARMAELGIGIARNPGQALALYKVSAKKGSAKAHNRLGVMYFKGEHLLQDYTLAQEHFCKAADLGEKNGQFNCANMSADGSGGKKDMKKALGLYEKAAAQNHIGAVNVLGMAYRQGKDVKPDLVKAQGFFEKSAARGNPVGLYELGQMFETGKPIAKDLVKAHLYYNLASARRHPLARQALQRISAQLKPKDILAAQQKARDWKPLKK